MIIKTSSRSYGTKIARLRSADQPKVNHAPNELESHMRAPGVEVNRRIPTAANFPIRLSFPQALLITLLIKRLAVGEISHRSRSERIA